MALLAAAFLPAPARAQSAADAKEFNELLIGSADASAADNDDEAYHLAIKASELAKRIVPAGQSSREFAAYRVFVTAIYGHQTDALIARAADNAVAEMVSPDDGADDLAAAYGEAATTLHIDGRRLLSLEYAQRGLEASRRATSSCGAGAIGVLAGEAYRQFRKSEGERLNALYVEALHGRPCALSPQFTTASLGFDAMADGFMKMSPDAASVRSMITLALEVDEKSRSANFAAPFFRGGRLAVHYLQLPRPKRDIEAAFARTIEVMPAEMRLSKDGSDEVVNQIFVMRKAAQGDPASLARLDSVAAQIAKRSPPARCDVDVSAAKHLAKRNAQQARETLRTARKTLPPAAPMRLIDAASYLLAARSAGEDPFEMRQVAEEAMQDEAGVWVENPTDAMTFEFMLATVMSTVDGADQYDQRAAKALSDAQSRHAADHPCLVKFMLERAAALHAVRRQRKLTVWSIGRWAYSRRRTDVSRLPGPTRTKSIRPWSMSD